MRVRVPRPPFYPSTTKRLSAFCSFTYGTLNRGSPSVVRRLLLLCRHIQYGTFHHEGDTGGLSLCRGDRGRHWRPLSLCRGDRCPPDYGLHGHEVTAGDTGGLSLCRGDRGRHWRPLSLCRGDRCPPDYGLHGHEVTAGDTGGLSLCRGDRGRHWRSAEVTAVRRTTDYTVRRTICLVRRTRWSAELRGPPVGPPDHVVSGHHSTLPPPSA